jgi:hypothetical protein
VPAVLQKKKKKKKKKKKTLNLTEINLRSEKDLGRRHPSGDVGPSTSGMHRAAPAAPAAARGDVAAEEGLTAAAAEQAGSGVRRGSRN